MKDGHSEPCTIKSVRMKNLHSPLEYEILLDSSDSPQFVTKESLVHLESSNISDVKLSDEQVKELGVALNSWQSNAKSWSGPVECPLMREFKGWHHRLNHLSFEKMFHLCENSVLPRKFLKLRCVNCFCVHHVLFPK